MPKIKDSKSRITKVTLGLLGVLLSLVLYFLSSVVTAAFAYLKIFWMIEAWKWICVAVFAAGIIVLGIGLLKKE